MIEFDMKKAMSGATVQTRVGNRVRIVCFDADCSDPIVALIATEHLVTGSTFDIVRQYPVNGRYSRTVDSDADLMIDEDVCDMLVDPPIVNYAK